MAETQEDRAKSTLEDFQKQNDDIRKAAEDAREAEGAPTGETEEEYRERIANVPGIFGDIDTTAGVGATGTDTLAADNEQATVDQAAATADAQDGDEEAAEQVQSGAARRQTQAAATGETAEEVNAASGDAEDQDKADEKAKEAKEKGSRPAAKKS